MTFCDLNNPHLFQWASYWKQQRDCSLLQADESLSLKGLRALFYGKTRISRTQHTYTCTFLPTTCWNLAKKIHAFPMDQIQIYIERSLIELENTKKPRAFENCEHPASRRIETCPEKVFSLSIFNRFPFTHSRFTAFQYCNQMHLMSAVNHMIPEPLVSKYDKHATIAPFLATFPVFSAGIGDCKTVK